MRPQHVDTDLVSCSTSSLGVRSREAVLDVQGCTMFCLANGPDSAVHFHRSPAAEEISQFRVCEAVSDEAVARSTVLSSIAEAGGDAQLPGAVTLAGFRIWRNLASGNPDISVKSLCIGYQVADALDDHQIDTWTAQLLNRILAQPSPTSHSTDTPNPRRRNKRRGGQSAASAAVSQLPATLQHRLFTAASLRLDTQNSTHNLLQHLSPSLHPAILSSSISPQRHLTVTLCHHRTANQFFRALSAMAPASSSSGMPPPILSLNLYAGLDLTPCSWATPAKTIPASADYAAALARHTGLTHLTIGAFEPPFVQGIARALPALAALKRLRLGNDSLDEACYPDTLQHLCGPLQRLPALEHLTIELVRMFSQKVTLTGDRNVDLYSSMRSDYITAYQRAMDAVPCLSRLLSNIPGLTSLHLSPASPILDTDRALHCPRLRHLEVSQNWFGFMMTDQLLQNLRAPALTSLSLVGSSCYETDVPEQGLSLFRHLPPHSSLRRLDVRIPQLMMTYQRWLWHEAMFRQLPPALVALPLLHHLDIEADSELLLRALPAAASRLRHLNLSCRFPGGRATDQRRAWADLYSDLSMPHLTSLALTWMNNVEAEAMPGIGSLLRACGALQRLVVRQYRCAFLGDDDVGALSGLTALVEMGLEGADIAVPLHARLAAALLPLSALQCVCVTDCGLADVFVRALAEGGVAAWPELQTLELGCSAVATAPTAEEVVRAVAGRPPFKELVLVVNETVRGEDRGKRHPRLNDGDSEFSDDMTSVESLDLDQDRYNAGMRMSQADAVRVSDLAAELTVPLSWR